MNLITKIFKKGKAYKGIPSPTTSFDSVINLTEAFLENKSDSDKIVILDYIIDILKVDICSSGIVEPFIIQPSEPYNYPFPNSVYDENGNTINGRKGIIEIELDKTDIYVRPWNVERQFKSILSLKDIEFEYDKTNHWSLYYSDINLCYVFNGNHSINAGKYFKKGKINSEYLDLTLLYPHCYTDGKHWYNSHTNDIIADVDDFRLATIYELAKKRFFIKNK